jgi:hypothetical protein
MSERPLLGYFGHHKCGSTWFQAICGEVCRELKLRFQIVYHAENVGNDLNAFVRNTGLDFISYNNAHYTQVQALGPMKGFHVVRDPRDICVSAYYSHRYSHKVEGWPEMQRHRRRLEEVTEEEGILLEMDWLQRHFDEMRSWPDTADGILQLKMEDITAEPFGHMLRVFQYLGVVDDEDFTAARRLKHFAGKLFRKIEHLSGRRISIPFAPQRLPAERVLGIIWEHDFSRKTKGRALGQEDVTSHYRKGTPGDWKNHFTAKHVSYFKEKYNDLLVQYGYEQDDRWNLIIPDGPVVSSAV